MSGHSKWSTIKHKKAALDSKRGKLWSKLSRNVTMAARTGGDPGANSRLRLAVEKAKDANMPRDTIEKAIKKGTGELEGETIEEVVYEGYGTKGVAFMCHTLTDNRNRTGPEIKKLFERHGGHLGAPNCVAWMFTQKGIIVIEESAADEDQIIELALEAGAEDVSASAINYEITCPPDAFLAVKGALEAASIPLVSADMSMVASSTVTLDANAARKIMKLMDELDDHDDVQTVSANFDIPDDVMADLAAG
ncbi:MAG: YebC/PmpR family DNA-binding transcriptional regulator [Planctomycetes bacterium]|nr:YebC/PmpR family DNA-binding transcriptional regulator [Planctomycetota bacterium]